MPARGNEILTHKEEEEEEVEKDQVVRVSSSISDSYMMEKEKQISVDPRSLKNLKKSRDVDDRSPVGAYPPGLPLPPPKLKLVSASLPNSATSSPRSVSSSSTLMKNLKKWRNQNQTSLAIRSLARQHSATVSPFAHQQGSSDDLFRRSKSCGEGRACAPSDEFDFWARKATLLRQETGDSIDISHHYEFYHQINGKNNGHDSDPLDKAFKCGALCLFLPGFGKGSKAVRGARKDIEEEEEVGGGDVVLSRTVSLEKFECGSWASSARIASDDNEDGGESRRSYFDLPLELIRDGVNDAHSPVSTAFVFERDVKGALKKSSSSRARGVETSRHVRFSTSNSNAKSKPNSPSCISPRLRKARDDFNAYLQAQGA